MKILQYTALGLLLSFNLANASNFVDQCQRTPEHEVTSQVVGGIPGVTKTTQVYKCIGAKGPYWSTTTTLVHGSNTILSSKTYQRSTVTPIAVNNRFPIITRVVAPVASPSPGAVRPPIITPHRSISSVTNLKIAVTKAVSNVVSAVKSYLGVGGN